MMIRLKDIKIICQIFNKFFVSYRIVYTVVVLYIKQKTMNATACEKQLPRIFMLYLYQFFPCLQNEK